MIGLVKMIKLCMQAQLSSHIVQKELRKNMLLNSTYM